LHLLQFAYHSVQLQFRRAHRAQRQQHNQQQSHIQLVARAASVEEYGVRDQQGNPRTQFAGQMFLGARILFGFESQVAPATIQESCQADLETPTYS
jgi:hypothetical protein